jgi:hypothetical protein
VWWQGLKLDMRVLLGWCWLKGRGPARGWAFGEFTYSLIVRNGAKLKCYVAEIYIVPGLSELAGFAPVWGLDSYYRGK